MIGADRKDTFGDIVPRLAVLDDANLVSRAGLVPVMALAVQTGLPDVLDERVVCERVRSGATNRAGKLMSLIEGMAAGADSVRDLDVIRAGGMKKVFGGVYAPATSGILQREFTHGHTRQLSTVLRGLPAGVDPADRGAGRHRGTGGGGHRFAAASGVRARQAGRLVRPPQDREPAGPTQGLSPLVTTISTATEAA